MVDIPLEAESGTLTMTGRLIVTPPSESIWHALRAADVTSTESSALFGESPYATKFELWHRKKDGAIVSIPDNPRMAWGRRVQDAIAQGIAADQGWKVRPMREYMRLTEARMGASFDYEVTDPVRGKGILEIKNVDYIVFRDKWTDDDEGMEAPAHIEIQLQHQLHLAEREWGAIGVLIGGNDARVLIRQRDMEIGAAIESQIREFWRTIGTGIEPPAVYPADAEFVSRLYSYAEVGKVFDGRGNHKLEDLLIGYTDASSRMKEADEDKKVARAQILQMVGEAERVIADGFSVSCGLVGPAQIPAYERKGFRNFRCTVKKESKV